MLKNLEETSFRIVKDKEQQDILRLKESFEHSVNLEDVVLKLDQET